MSSRPGKTLRMARGLAVVAAAAALCALAAPATNAAATNATATSAAAGAAAATTRITASRSPAQLVDTRTWTNPGNTFPGADVPWGMAQWSPDTMPTRPLGGGYNYGDTQLIGYSLTHISGPGCGAAGDVPILPMTGGLPSGDPGSFMTSFTNTGEIAQAGYYSAESNLPATIVTQLAETPHSAMARMTFPKTRQAGILIKLLASQNGVTKSGAGIIGNNEVKGMVQSGGFCGGGPPPSMYNLHFDITFDQPFTMAKIVNEGQAPGPNSVYLNFDTTRNPVIQAKVGISYVSADNARLNWQTENRGWDFNGVKAGAQMAWNNLLGMVKVRGPDATKVQQFYSTLYKIFVQPNITSDVNGQYIGAGSDGIVRTISRGQRDQYGIFSGWDTYHATAQIQAMLDPQAASDQATSQLNYFAQNGLLQQWGYLNENNYVMTGDPMQGIIADYYAFGARNFDVRLALRDMITEATTVNQVRPGEHLEQKYGYLPEDGTYGCCNPHGYVSTLLELNQADFALSRFAKALGDQTTATMLQNRANNWVNVFDTSTGLLTPRLQNGQFVGGVGPTDSSHYIEGSAYEYLWQVPNDYAGLFSLLGGNNKVVPMLQQYLSQPNGGGMFGLLSNEFDFGQQNALDYAGYPAGTQQAVNNMRWSLYSPGPFGFGNNDDVGAASAQFVWSMLGMYPENAGDGTLVFASPGFPYAQITLPTGKTITINAPGASPTRFYVDSMNLNGKPYSKVWTTFDTLALGSTLDWTLGTTPTSWGSAASDAPPSYGPVFGGRGAATPSPLVIQPNKSVTASLTVQSAGMSAQNVSFTSQTTGGIKVSPATGSFTLAPQGTHRVPITVTAGSKEGSFQVTFTLTTTGPNRFLPVPMSVIVAKPGDLSPFYNVKGISNDSAPQTANYDGGGASYSEQSLTSHGLPPGASVSSGGLTYTWPNVPAGQLDAIFTGGQTIPLRAAAGAHNLGFLGSAINAGTTGSQGAVTINYTDGTTSSQMLGFSDWTLGGGGGTPQFGNLTVAATPYRNVPGGQQAVTTYVFSQTVPVDSSKTVASVTLPSMLNQGAIGIFAIATG